MSQRAIRLHRSYGHQDMHERLRRLLYEAFFGVESAGAAPDPREYGRPRLLLVSPSWRAGMQERGDRKARGTSLRGEETGEDGVSTSEARDIAPNADVSKANGREAWVKPTLHRLG
jgi:hypothetical protein